LTNDGELSVKTLEQWRSPAAAPSRAEPRGRSISALASTLGAVERLLPEGYPSLQKTVKELGSSPRTLQCRLREPGVGYGQLVLRCRLARARRLLADSTMRVGEIAAKLGYADPSSFNRFFLREAGMTPLAYRARARSTSPRPR